MVHSISLTPPALAVVRKISERYDVNMGRVVDEFMLYGISKQPPSVTVSTDDTPGYRSMSVDSQLYETFKSIAAYYGGDRRWFLSYLITADAAQEYVVGKFIRKIPRTVSVKLNVPESKIQDFVAMLEEKNTSPDAWVQSVVTKAVDEIL